jgi:hypothetical protein
MPASRAAAEGVAFLLELCALAAVAYRGYVGAGIWLAAVAPLALAVFWGLVCSPRRRFDLGTWPTFGLRLAVLLGAAVLLGGRLGLALGIAVLVDYAWLAVLRDPVAGA